MRTPTWFMRMHGVLVVAVLISVSASAECFNFATGAVVDTPLKEAPPQQYRDSTEVGTRADNTAWAAIRGDVLLPLERVLELMLEHQVYRDPAVTEVVVEKLAPGPYLVRRRVHQTAKRFFFEVKWTEEWAVALAGGAPDVPERVVISFQKTEGTAHIQHYCGNIVLRRTPKGTEFSSYQESRATRRSSQAILESQSLLLRRLRTQ